MERINENNQLTVRGKIINELEFAYEVAGEQFFRTTISVPRTSGSVDELQIIVSERLLDVNDTGLVGRIVNIYGEFRSFNKNADYGRRKLILTVFVKEIKFEDEYDYSNKANCIRLVGTVCNKPFCRETPLGRTIADLTLAVNRGFGKSDYIPCVFWGRNAKYASEFEVGTVISLSGRVQSRNYIKKISEYDYEERTAYEVSAKTVEVIKIWKC